MTRGVRLYLVGSFVLVSLAGCGRGFFQTEEREPWRAEAEIACLKSGAVKESAGTGPDRPDLGPRHLRRRVSAEGRGARRKQRQLTVLPTRTCGRPATIGNQPRWPVAAAAASRYPPHHPPIRASTYPESAVRQPGYGGAPGGPVSLTAPGVAPRGRRDRSAARGHAGIATPAAVRSRAAYHGAEPIRADRATAPYSPRPTPPAAHAERLAAARTVAGQSRHRRRAGRGKAGGDAGLSDRLGARSLARRCVQPAAMRWFGARVVEIKQISAYSCRGMNGNSYAHISEHAFGNALDIAAFTLADGRHISVKDGWKGLPEEQGFLRDVQAAACQQFTTVLAPGSNVYHYDHIHVDLMRRASRRLICQPAAMSGEEVAARAARRNPYAVARALRDGIAGRIENRGAPAPEQGRRGRRVRGPIAAALQPSARGGLFSPWSRNSRHGDPMKPSEQIDRLIAGLTDWRGKTFASVRKSILEADREIIEEWKWMGSPVWYRDGMIAVANAHKGKVKLTFAYGAKPGRSRQALQRRPRRQRETSHRFPRGGQGQRACSENISPCAAIE